MTIGTARRDRYLKIAHRVRGIPGEQYGLRPHTVAIVQGSWSGAHTGDGSEDTTETAIVESGQPSKVRWLSDEQITVGSLAKGTVQIGPITPLFPGGGTDLNTLIGKALDKGETMHLKIVGPKHPDGALYVITKLNADRALRYLITAEPVVEL